MTVKITQPSDYKLYLTKEIDREYPEANNKKKEAIIEMMMASFYDGISFNQNGLKVEV